MANDQHKTPTPEAVEKLVKRLKKLSREGLLDREMNLEAAAALKSQAARIAELEAAWEHQLKQTCALAAHVADFVKVSKMVHAAILRLSHRDHKLWGAPRAAEAVNGDATWNAALNEAAKTVAKRCKCGGAMWLWAHEISSVGSTTDDTKYDCRDQEFCELVDAIRSLKRG